MPSALRIKEIRDLEDNVFMSNGSLYNVNFDHIPNVSIAGEKINLNISDFSDGVPQYHELGNIRFAYGYITTPSTATYIANYGTQYYSYTSNISVTNYKNMPIVVSGQIQGTGYEDAGTTTLSNHPSDQGNGTWQFRYMMRSRAREGAITNRRVAFFVIGEKYVVRSE